MAEMASAVTPKRKRGEAVAVTPIKFNFDISHTAENDDGGESPRSKVAHRFRGLALDSGGGVAEEEDGAPDHGTKRVRSDVVMSDAQQTVELPDEVPKLDLPAQNTETSKAPEGSGSLQRAYPSINRLSESKSRRRKRLSSPPPRRKKVSPTSSDEEVEIVEPIRAALTWREDEITIYDPEDEDDDGTGINGIGFKPTPALAHARVMKRRQQMEGYRKREEGEARARRNARRREAIAEEKAKVHETARRVRFGELNQGETMGIS